MYMPVCPIGRTCEPRLKYKNCLNDVVLPLNFGATYFAVRTPTNPF